MSFLLDTDTCSAYLKGHRQVWQRFMQYGGRLHVSAVSVGELWTWAARAAASPKRRQVLDDFLSDLTVLDVTSQVAEKFGEVRAGLLDSGQGTPDMDLLIAATALIHGLTLVTHNTRDFEKVPGLIVEDWLVL